MSIQGTALSCVFKAALSDVSSPNSAGVDERNGHRMSWDLQLGSTARLASPKQSLSLFPRFLQLMGTSVLGGSRHEKGLSQRRCQGICHAGAVVLFEPALTSLDQLFLWLWGPVPGES